MSYKSNPNSCHDHGNCKLCDQIDRDLATTRSALLREEERCTKRTLELAAAHVAEKERT